MWNRKMNAMFSKRLLNVITMLSLKALLIVGPNLDFY